MRKSRFTEEQIIKVLKEHAAGLSAGEVCRKYGISDATFYKWRSISNAPSRSFVRSSKSKIFFSCGVSFTFLTPLTTGIPTFLPMALARRLTG